MNQKASELRNHPKIHRCGGAGWRAAGSPGGRNAGDGTVTVGTLELGSVGKPPKERYVGSNGLKQDEGSMIYS